jgi:hypothetical protein
MKNHLPFSVAQFIKYRLTGFIPGSYVRVGQRTQERLFLQMEDREIDEMLGVLRCDRCGHRLENEIECPFCTPFFEPREKDGLPKWIYLTACFVTSPLSIYFVLKSNRLNYIEKIVGVSGCCLWAAFYFLRL